MQRCILTRLIDRSYWLPDTRDHDAIFKVVNSNVQVRDSSFQKHTFSGRDVPDNSSLL